MTNRKHKGLIIIGIFAVSMLGLSAQELPEMPSDPAIKTGSLPNGTRYYIVSDPTSKGTADFALVSRTGTKTAGGADLVSASKDALGALPRLSGLSPQKFFLSGGAAPLRRGYVTVSEASTVFRFKNVRLSDRPDMLDSSLLHLTGMIDRLYDAEAGLYSPSDNAVIVVGDVVAEDVVAKLRMLSLMVPYGGPQPREEYVWRGDVPAGFVSSRSDGLAKVELVWDMPRTPSEYMGTTQPVIYRFFLGEFGTIVSDRIRTALRQRDIPFARVSTDHLTSSRTSSDEKFVVSVVAGEDAAESVVEVVAQVLGNTDRHGVTMREMKNAEKAYLRDVTASEPGYVERCIDSFLRGASLAGGEQVRSYLESREVSDSTELRLLNVISSALINEKYNLRLTCSCTEGPGPEALRDVFERSWNKDSFEESDFRVSDTLLSYSLPPQPLKLKSSKKDHLSSGVVWTFSNGQKVVYKRMDTGGEMYWSLGLGGGFGSIPDLSAGEGAFIGDCLRSSRVAGMEWDDFSEFLAGKGIMMKVSTGLSRTTLSGVAPKQELPLLMRSLLAVANEREPSPEAFRYYQRCEWLKNRSARINCDNSASVIDSLMCPDYVYSKVKTSGKLTEDTFRKALAFYDELFARVNHGLLVIVSDMEETAVRKTLASYLGGFRTRKTAFLLPSVSYQPVSGWSTHVEDGDHSSIYVSLSAPMPLTSSYRMAAEIADHILGREVAASLAGAGMYMRFRSSLSLVPQERHNVMITLHPADPDGFAPGSVCEEEWEALRLLRSCLDEVADKVTDADVKTYKEWLKNHISVMMKSPEYWTEAVLRRYLDGKDFTTAYKEKIDSVTADLVRQMLKDLNNSSKVEYIIRKR